jgi:putative ABC transport system permease protein
MRNDIRYALRTLAKRPGFAAAVIATLAIGIGANTAIFSVVHAVLLKPPPYERPEELVRIWGSYAQHEVVLAKGNVSPLDALDWRAQCRSFSGIALFNTGNLTLTGSGEPLRLRAGVATANFFQVLGVRPAIGNVFTEENEIEGRHRVALLSDGFWQRRFGADPRVVGTVLTLNGSPYTIAGVLPRSFRGPAPSADGEPDLWRPLVLPREPGARGGHYLMAVGRLAPGVSHEAAQREIDVVTARLLRAFPATNTGWRIILENLQRASAGDSRSTLLVLAGAVGCVLAIACANIAGLLLCRAAARRREIAIRRALGAGTLRLVRQLMIESLVLAAAGGAAGLLLALWAVQALAPLAAAGALDVSPLDPAVLAFTAALVVATGLAFGLAPALASARIDPQQALQSGASSTAPSSARARKILVAGEVAVAVLLLTAAGLFLRSLRFVMGEEPGFRPEGVLTFSIALPAKTYGTPEKQVLFHRQLGERLGALPGVRAVGAINALPLAGGYSCDSFALADRPAPPAGTEPCAENRIVGGDYFPAMGIRLTSGRLFSPQEDARAPGVAIVNETFARTWWPGRSALGQRLKWGDYKNTSDWLTVVGVVSDVRHFGLSEPPRAEIDTAYAQNPDDGMGVVVRTDGALAGLAPAVRAAVAGIDKDLPVYNLRSMEEYVGRSTARPRQRAGLTGVFAAVAILLAAVGVFATVAFSVVSRTREIGIRMALGAGRKHILTRILGQGLRPVLAGAAVGLAAAAVAARLLTTLLYRVPAMDPIVFVAVPVVLSAVAVLAAWLPARRAARISPLEALRHE